MYNTDILLSRLSHARSPATVTLSSLIPFSFSELRTQYDDLLSWGESQYLYREAQEQKKRNLLLEAKVFTQANPQLTFAINRGLAQSAETYGYNELFGQRANAFVGAGSVASMFSPAGYLTELYREAKDLHLASSAYNLATRRPDLALLVLNQQNMDEEISTLALSNDILMAQVEKNTGKSGDDLLQLFATERKSALTPYHRPYETLRNALLALDPTLEGFSQNPAVLKQADSNSLLALMANISPELHTILIEDINEGNADKLFEQNFAVPLEELKTTDNIANYYGLTPDYIAQFTGGKDVYYNIVDDNLVEGPIYINDKLTTTVQEADNSVKTYYLNISDKANLGQHHYLELLPLGGLKFRVRFSVTSTQTDFSTFSIQPASTSPDKDKWLEEASFVPQANKHYSRDISLTADQIKRGVTVGLKRTKPGIGNFNWTNCSFDIQAFSPSLYLLKLNKAIRLCYATGLTPNELQSIVYSNDNVSGIINDNVLTRLFYTLFYRARYALPTEQALVLAGGLIVRSALDNETSFFDRLFNTPPLDGEYFSANGDTVSVDPMKEESSHAHNALLRGLGVTHSELCQLATIAALPVTNHTISLSPQNISALYRTVLLARLHHLTVNELNLLNRTSGKTLEQLAEYVEWLYEASNWMSNAGLSATSLWALSTGEYGETLTQEMRNLSAMIAAGVTAAEINAAADDAALCRLAAPYIAGAMSLSSPGVAQHLLQWCAASELLTEISLKQFMTLLIQAETLTGAKEKDLALYLQVLAQHALMCGALQLSEAEVEVLARIGDDQFLYGKRVEPRCGVDLIVSLSHFHSWVNGLGRNSTDILSALCNNTLNTTQLSDAMGLDESLLKQALSYVNPKESTLGNWQTIDEMLQWVSAAKALNTMPSSIKQLIDIRLTDNTRAVPTWDSWKALSRAIEASLTPKQAQEVAANAAGRLSDVLCNWFLTNVSTDGITLKSRDDLYSYFLIDNQVSEQIKTTRIAEAIAGIQLYVNRALNRIEPNAVSDVSTRQFFLDWDLNSRYSTWGGISRLVYYPENYVDPLQRIGQTKMMDELLQNINQSQLNQDTVEDAFKTYLARFETVADLKVISAYHDNVNADHGLTWLVGRGREAQAEYYWRHVDMSRFQGGKLAANAWSEWVKIDAPVNAWKDTVRPVVFRDRLYLTWVERDEVAKNGGNSNPEMLFRYTLKMAFLRHDGNWSSPWSYDVTGQVKDCLGDNDKPGAESLERLGLCASGYQGENTLMVFVYKLQSKDYIFNDDTESGKGKGDRVRGMTIYADGSRKVMDKDALSRFNVLAATLDKLNDKQPDGVVRKANYRFAVDYDIASSLTLNDAVGAYKLTKLTGAKIPQITLKSSSEDIMVTLNNAAFSVGYTSSDSLRSRQIEGLKFTGFDGKSQYGDTFIIPDESVNYEGALYPKNNGPVASYNQTKDYINCSILKGFTWNSEDRFLCIPVAIGNGSQLPVGVYDKATVNLEYKGFAGSLTSAVFNVGSDKQAAFKKAVYFVFGNKERAGRRIYWAHKVTGWLDINTKVNPTNVTISVQAGSKTHEFTAKDYVTAMPEGTFGTMQYAFDKAMTFNANTASFVNNRAQLTVTFEAKSAEGRSLGKTSNTLTINKVNYAPEAILQLSETAAGVQYMQHAAHRIRLNTQLAPALVSRANTGIDAILSMETQQLAEAKLGDGTFVTLTFDKYNKDIHGTSRAFSIEFVKVFEDTDAFPLYSGMLSESGQTVVTLFVPRIEDAFGIVDNLYLAARWQKGLSAKLKLERKSVNAHDPEGWTFEDGLFAGLLSVDGFKQPTTPLDFNSASALYYWELFYYVPMMCFRRFLQEKKFSEARQWLSYVYDPNGYIVNGKIAPWTWNCRPLEETTSWNANPLDAIDPDAVAQNDPTHYKVATFMGYVEMLITRGDMCYRELTRDALNEAKMWYLHALEVMGKEPKESGDESWNAPTLNEAARETRLVAMQTALSQMDKGEVPSGQERTANSLTNLFLPEFNPALTECWTTLRQRLFNLRHNLSISGQPLSLSIYAEPADPKALQASQVQASQGGSSLPAGMLPLYRFPIMLERARNLTSQLVQFGGSLLSMAGNYDADQLSTLLLQQGMELSLQSIAIQRRSLDEIDANITELTETRTGAQQRLEKYTQLYNEDVSSGERQAMALSDTASGLTLAGQALGMVGGGLDMVPNVFGLACGGSRWGALAHAGASGMFLQANAIQMAADKVSRSEMYRRRRQEWEIQRDSAQSEVNQIDARIAGVKISREAAAMQISSLETQHGHTLAQLELLQRKFTSQVLYSWMRGKLSAIYYQFFDITQSFCLMAQGSLRRELSDNGLTFIRGSAWNGSTSGLMAGETLMLSLADMEKAWTERDERALEVTRTVSLAQVYAALKTDEFTFTDAVNNNVQTSGNKTFGPEGNQVKRNGAALTASVKLSDLNINNDYPSDVLTSGKNRHIKQISVTLPALVGPYEDVRAILNYGGSVDMPKGCSAIAISHGMNDSGQFVLDFNDARYLPFEGIPVDDTGSLTLSFPDATESQKTLLQSLSDIILHIRYTIRS